MKSRYEGIQNYIMHADASCFFLSLLSIAEEENYRQGAERPEVDFLDAARECMNRGWLRNDFTVLYDCAILKHLTGRKCLKEVVQNAGIVSMNQYTIEKWAWGEKTHFRRRGFDVYTDSKTVANGVKQCYYKYTFK